LGFRSKAAAIRLLRNLGISGIDINTNKEFKLVLKKLFTLNLEGKSLNYLRRIGKKLVRALVRFRGRTGKYKVRITVKRIHEEDETEQSHSEVHTVERRSQIGVIGRKMLQIYKNKPDEDYYIYDDKIYSKLFPLWAEDSNILDGYYGLLVNSYEKYSVATDGQTSGYSCGVEELVRCGYKKCDIEEYFGHLDDKIILRDIINFIESKNGAILLFDLFNSVLYRRVNSTNHHYKSFMAYLANEHIYPIYDSSDRTRVHRRISGTLRSKIGKKIKRKNNKIVYTEDVTKHFYNFIKENKIIPEKYSMNEDATVNHYLWNGVIYTSNENLDLCKKLNNGVPTIRGVSSLMLSIFHKIFEKRSVMSENVSDIFDNFNIGGKRYLFNDKETVDVIDNNKSYSDALMKIPYYYVDICDEFVKTDKFQGIGVYVVETEDYHLFRGTGIYYDEVLKTAMEHNIDFKIKAHLNVRCREKSFENFVRTFYKKMSPKEGKNCVNRLIGTMNKKSFKQITKTCIVDNPIDACYYLNKYDADIYQFGGRYFESVGRKIIEKHPELDNFFVCELSTSKEIIETDRLLYYLILNQSYLTMFNKMDEVGIENVTYIKTDAIGLTKRYTGKLDYNIGGWKREELKDIPGLYKPFRSIDFVTHIDDDLKWEVTKLINKKSVKLPEKSMLLTGKAGTTKTTTGLKFLEGKRVLKLSFMNTTARLIGGRTFHSTFNCMFTDLSKTAIKKINKNYDYVFVDEISNLNIDLYRVLALLKRKSKPDMKFILVGDIKCNDSIGQCLPIEDHKTDYYKTNMLKRICDCNHYILTVVHRYDFDYDKLDHKKYKPHSYLNMRMPRGLCFTNVCRIRLNNDIIMNKFKGKTYKQGYPMIVKGTIKSEQLYNNEVYKIIKVRKKEITIKSTLTGEIKIYTRDYMSKYFDYAFVMTVYKSQGLSFNFPYFISEFNKLDKVHRYVAITRTTKLRNLVNFNK